MTRMTDLLDQSAVAQIEALQAGTISAPELMTATLDRIEARNPAVNAIVALQDRDALLKAAATTAGPLAGLPMAIKDLADTAGIKTTYGSPIFANHVPTTDSTMVAALKNAGAIIIGKTNTPEFGTGSHTFNEVFGVTRNPWNVERSAGGSSGGAAAALAARMLPIADGSDFGGSLRNPAAFCNVVGLRPGIGRVADPATTSTHVVRLGVTGPMGRTVADTALVLSALAGHDHRDPLALRDDPARFRDPLPTSTSARLAWGGDLGLMTCEPRVLALCEEAAFRVVAAGGTFEAEAPDLSPAMDVFRVLRGMSYRRLGAALTESQLGEVKGTVRENIEYGRALDADDVLRAEAKRADLHRLMSAFFDRHDVLALPAAQVAPFPAHQEFPTEIAGVQMDDYLEWMTTCCVITATGCPAISIPAGFTDDGLPVGLQLVARVGAERQLLEIASAIEAQHRYCDQSPAM